MRVVRVACTRTFGSGGIGGVEDLAPCGADLRGVRSGRRRGSSARCRRAVSGVVPVEEGRQKARACSIESNRAGKSGRYLRVRNCDSENELSFDTCGREWLLVTARSDSSSATGLDDIDEPGRRGRSAARVRCSASSKYQRAAVRQRRRLAGSQQPAGHVPGVDVDDHVQVPVRVSPDLCMRVNAFEHRLDRRPHHLELDEASIYRGFQFHSSSTARCRNSRDNPERVASLPLQLRTTTDVSIPPKTPSDRLLWAQTRRAQVQILPSQLREPAGQAAYVPMREAPSVRGLSASMVAE